MHQNLLSERLSDGLTHPETLGSLEELFIMNFSLLCLLPQEYKLQKVNVSCFLDLTGVQ